jgi:hypothetical protein
MEKVTNSSSSTTHRRTWWCDVCKKQGSHSTDRCFKNPLNVTHQRPDGHSQRPDGHSQRPDGHSQRPDGQRVNNGSKYNYTENKSNEKNEKNEKKQEVFEKKDTIKTVAPCVPRPVMTGWAAKASIPVPVKSEDDVTCAIAPPSSGFVSLTKESIGSGVSSKRDMNYRIKPQNNINEYCGDDYDEY